MPTCDLICTKDLNKFSEVAFTVEPRPSGLFAGECYVWFFQGDLKKTAGSPRKLSH